MQRFISAHMNVNFTFL